VTARLEIVRAGALPGDDGQLLLVDRADGPHGRTVCIVPGRLVASTRDGDCVRRLDLQDLMNARLFAAARELRESLIGLLTWEAKMGGCDDPRWAKARRLVVQLYRSPDPEGVS